MWIKLRFSSQHYRSVKLHHCVYLWVVGVVPIWLHNGNRSYRNVLWLLLLVRLLFFYYFSYAACELLVAGLQFGLFSTRAVVLVTVSCKRYKVEQPRKWMVYSNSHACTSFFISGEASSASLSGAGKCGFVRPPVLTTIKKIITLQLIQFKCNFLCPLIPFCLWKMDCNL